MELTITDVDYAPSELHDQVPIVISLLRKIPGDDRPDYWIGESRVPITWMNENNQLDVSHVVLAARWEGTSIAPGVSQLPVGIAYVTDLSLLEDSKLDFHKCEYVAIGISHDSSNGAPTKRNESILAGTICRLFGVGNRN